MDLGAFSVSLAVKDLAASRAFYEKFGFDAFAGEAAQGWLILKNGTCVIPRPTRARGTRPGLRRGLAHRAGRGARVLT